MTAYPRSMQHGQWVTLTHEQLKRADEFGNLMHQRAAERQYRDVYQSSGAIDRCHAMRCEHALAVFLDVPWEPDITAFSRKPDVAHCDVRSRTWARVRSNDRIRIATQPGAVPRANYLIIRPKDPSERPFVLVYGGDEEHYLIVGWIYGFDAKQEKWRFDRMEGQSRGLAAYWIPETALRCPTELKGRT